jgi:hypothetical protein
MPVLRSITFFASRVWRCFSPDYSNDPGGWRRYEEASDLYEGDNSGSLS